MLRLLVGMLTIVWVLAACDSRPAESGTEAVTADEAIYTLVLGDTLRRSRSHNFLSGEPSDRVSRVTSPGVAGRWTAGSLPAWEQANARPRRLDAKLGERLARWNGHRFVRGSRVAEMERAIARVAVSDSNMVSLSAVGHLAEGSRALVRLISVCGERCGSGIWYEVARDGNGTWVVVSRWQEWES